MNEYLVEWALLRERNYLQECIKLPLESKVCQQYTTEYGRIDFAHKIKNDGYLITELETILDNKAKLLYCFEQCLQYKNIVLANNFEHKVAILFAKQTPNNYYKDIQQYCYTNGILYFDYDIQKTKKIYENEIQKALINNGVPLSKPVAMNFTHLGGLNRLFISFYEQKATKLQKKEFKKYFDAIDTDVTETIFNVHCQAASYFDLIVRNKDTIELTDYGIRFRDNINYIEIVDNILRIELSIE